MLKKFNNIMMKRKVNSSELRRLKLTQEGGTVIEKSIKKPRLSKSHLPIDATNFSREELTAFIVEVATNIQKHIDFDLQKWLNQYISYKSNPNFPEAAMLIISAAQIYGRKVDYLEEMILHMEKENKEKCNKAEDIVKTKRVSRFRPETLSDCFQDLEFSYKNIKTVPIASLITKMQKTKMNDRSKLEKMKVMCDNFRLVSCKQKRHELLQQLRDEADMSGIMSSHTAARRSHIYDYECDEIIGTRYDYQMHLNYINIKNGGLMAEHDLKKFFQRCDYIDYMFEKQEHESGRCEKLGLPQKDKLLPIKPREFRIYIPPVYMINKYKILMDDTFDFDNALHEIKTTQCDSDSILRLMNSKYNSNVGTNVDPVSNLLDNCSSLNDSAYGSMMNDSLIQSEVGNMSHVELLVPATSNILSNEKALFNEQIFQTNFLRNKEIYDACNRDNTFISIDEGISLSDKFSSPYVGVLDCLQSIPKYEGIENLLFDVSFLHRKQYADIKFAHHLNNVILSPMQINLFGIQENKLRRTCLFSLPNEFKTVKPKIHKQKNVIKKRFFKVKLFNLYDVDKRKDQPDLELADKNFSGYQDSEENHSSVTVFDLSNRTDDSLLNELDSDEDFYGFEDEGNASNTNVFPSLLSSTLKNHDKINSQSSTPNRTMSRDSGISDVNSIYPESHMSLINSSLKIDKVSEINDLSYTQSITDAKELIEKVNAWHRKLKPILLESEKRNHFDIHTYGTEIIDSFDDVASKTPNITFKTIMLDKQKNFTSRYFLSLLQLTNTNNIEITINNHNPNRLTSIANIELKLVSRIRHHEEMQNINERIPNDNSKHKRKRIYEQSVCVVPEDRANRSHNERKMHNTNFSRDEEIANHEFLQNTLKLYPDINSKNVLQKRIAFRRGMRRCEYGIMDFDKTNPSAEKDKNVSIELINNDIIRITVDENKPCCSLSLGFE